MPHVSFSFLFFLFLLEIICFKLEQLNPVFLFTGYLAYLSHKYIVDSTFLLISVIYIFSLLWKTEE